MCKMLENELYYSGKTFLSLPGHPAVQLCSHPQDFFVLFSLWEQRRLWIAHMYFINTFRFSILLSKITPNTDCSNKILKIVLKVSTNNLRRI